MKIEITFDSKEILKAVQDAVADLLKEEGTTKGIEEKTPATAPQEEKPEEVVVPKEEAPKEETPKAEEKAPAITLDDLRKAGAKAARNGLSEQVQNLLKEEKVERLSDLPGESYGDFLKKLEGLSA